MIKWQTVRVIESYHSSSIMRNIIVNPEEIQKFQAGQHYEICLPGQDTIRKYSILSPVYNREHPFATPYLEFGIEFIEGGALSPLLWKIERGDKLNIRGPIGTSFVWDDSSPAPVVLLGAGSGMVPLVSIYHSHLNKYPLSKRLFIMTAKDRAELLSAASYDDLLITRFTATEPRIDLDFLKKNIGALVHDKSTMYFICGGDDFVDDMTKNILELGVAKENIKSERFI